ncbi:hypothetical protein [Arthrobacter dokdonensis]|uniref:hypothetical protein n=1 Tax=Arthrobacter dokdonellae TaxID=2211210 RepID=UPI000DE58616|nr:hypothetical protein [Arthrobacter dokdonellae]
MTDRGARLARGWTAAAFATSAAAFSHVLGGGDVPHPLLVLLSLAISALVCVALAGRVLSFKHLVAAVVVSEGLFHLLFSTTSASSSVRASALGVGQHAGMDMAGASPALATMGRMAGHDAGMWFSHAAAAGLTIGFLRYGESSAVRLLHVLRLEIAAVMGLAIVPIAAPSRIDAAPEPWLPALTALDVPLPVRHHRGPPLPGAAA